jgi:hypothetical protein
VSRLDALVAGTLDPTAFGHREHILVACEALERHDFFTAAALVAGGLARLAARAGAPEKFNATVTLAYLSLIAERLHLGSYRDAEDFLDRNPDLARPGLLAAHYSAARLGSDLARAVALLPDRAA